MSGRRLFTEEELALHGRGGRERFLDALGCGDPEEAIRVLEKILARYRQFHELYHGWTASLHSFLAERYGHEVASRLTALDDVLARSGEAGLDLEALVAFRDDPARAIRERLDAGDTAGVRTRFDAIEAGARGLHDFYRDAVSTVLSRIYREFGVEALAASLRASSEKDWMPWMLEEIESDPKTRLVEWAELLAVGNFGSIAIEEDDEKFVIVQSPCGSCGRQHRGGRYDAPWNLAVVQEKHPITYGTGGTTVYRAHIPMMHSIMPRERIGAPWPLIRCPRQKGGSCRIHLYKDPRQPVPDELSSWST